MDQGESRYCSREIKSTRRHSWRSEKTRKISHRAIAFGKHWIWLRMEYRTHSRLSQELGSNFEYARRRDENAEGTYHCVCSGVRCKHGRSCYALHRRCAAFMARCKNCLFVHQRWHDFENNNYNFQFIRTIPRQDEYLQKVPDYERALSQVLLDICVTRRKFMPKAQVVHYASHLCKVMTSMLDYLSKHSSYPESWPTSLNKFEIVIES